jgi:hypothetical protein
MVDFFVFCFVFLFCFLGLIILMLILILKFIFEIRIIFSYLTSLVCPQIHPMPLFPTFPPPPRGAKTGSALKSLSLSAGTVLYPSFTSRFTHIPSHPPFFPPFTLLFPTLSALYCSVCLLFPRSSLLFSLKSLGRNPLARIVHSISSTIFSVSFLIIFSFFSRGESG